MKADEIRDRFLRFFEERGHKVYPSASLVPANDPTLLFTGAGMNQFKEEFLGRVKGPRRAATCQKCLRTGDLENVGKTPDHHTFFEMLGNFSFGDYFKKEAIEWAWEFLTKDMGLKPTDLWVSVYEDDAEAYGIWKDVVKVPAKKILKLGAKENFWPSNAPAQGPNGPCGPCSEIFYGGPDGVEVWNLVFTQFDRQGNGRLEPLPNKNIDTGMGLERLARVLQGKKTNFEIDSFAPIIEAIQGLSRKKAKGQKKTSAIADHIRAVTFAIADSALPSNEERGYVIRKLIRKAFWYGRSLGLEKPFLYKLVPVVARVMKKPYPELAERREDIAQVVLAEEERFKNTIEEGLGKLNEMMHGPSGVIAGKAVFKLYDTYGFPPELTQEIAAAEKVKVEMEGFEECMRGQREKSRGSSKIKGAIFDVKGDAKLKLPDETIFIEDKEEIDTQVLQVTGNGVFLKETNFYGEKGGQIGDTGVLIKDGKVAAEVVDAIDIAGRVQHNIKPKTGKLKAGDKVTAKIDLERRENIRKNHTATHLLHNALRTVLGQHVKQAGSLVAPDRLRFDFAHFKALADQELSRVEELVNKYIEENGRVEVKEMGFDEAKAKGAIALFGEKYGDRVRMVSVSDYSMELCGGTHVKNTKAIGRFRIISESSIASGTRRIEAVTGDAAGKKIKEEKELVRRIADELKTAPENLIKEIEKRSARIKELEKCLEGFSARHAQSNIEEILKKHKKIKGYEVIVSEIKNADISSLRKHADIIKQRMEKDKVIYVLTSGTSLCTYMVVGTNNLPKQEQLKLDAGKILNDIGNSVGLKGGGRPDFAQAGGAGGKNIFDILERSKKVVERYL
ncbi:MAG: alanine--tRNA ligase [Candidatus Omnitrophica bacterium]|nr:alanine--tRNA ligase [Candidatus Omnitrophota bacterium]